MAQADPDFVGASGMSVGVISMACMGRVNLENNLHGTSFVYNYFESYQCGSSRYSGFLDSTTIPLENQRDLSNRD